MRKFLSHPATIILIAAVLIFTIFAMPFGIDRSLGGGLLLAGVVAICVAILLASVRVIRFGRAYFLNPEAEARMATPDAIVVAGIYLTVGLIIHGVLLYLGGGPTA